jgi:hypothetical protein
VANRTRRLPRLSAPALAGALTGLALVAIIWGAAWFWPPAETAGGGGNPVEPAPATAAATPATTVTARAELSAQPKATPAPPATPEVAAVPVRATVAYQVEAKGEVQGDIETFAAEVAEILADPRGWPAAGVAFERVASGGQITVWLAEPSTVPSFSSICSSNLSCSIKTNIIVNETRWLEGALPGVMDEVPLSDYRKMVVNHEMGHWLGHHLHSSCPGPGEVAPLMMQQSKGLDGCLFNPYPLPSELTAPDLFD